MKNLSPEENIKHNALSERIRSATLAGEFSGYFGALELEKQRLQLIRKWAKKQKDRQALADAYSATSSTYYAASGNARAKRQFVRAAWYLLWAMDHSNGAVDSARGIKNLTTDQLDVRASICRKCCCHGEARACVAEALSRDDISPETRVLLLLHQARDRRWRKAKDAFEMIDDIARRGGVPALTRVRVLRAKIIYFKKIGLNPSFIGDAWTEALGRAEAAGLKDQIAKIRAGL